MRFENVTSNYFTSMNLYFTNNILLLMSLFIFVTNVNKIQQNTDTKYYDFFIFKNEATY